MFKGDDHDFLFNSWMQLAFQFYSDWVCVHNYSTIKVKHIIYSYVASYIAIKYIHTCIQVYTCVHIHMYGYIYVHIAYIATYIYMD